MLLLIVRFQYDWINKKLDHVSLGGLSDQVGSALYNESPQHCSFL